MLKIKLLWLILGLSISTQAQNLVYNGNFEIFSQCPAHTLSQMNNQQIQLALGWQVGGQSPDYWDTCSNGTYNSMGYQQDALGGGGYAGAYVMASIYVPGDDVGREYISTKLLDTLRVGHKYLASMYVNRSNLWNYSIATLGMLFTDTTVGNNPNQPNLFTTPQIRNTNVLNDTANWVLIQDTILATGNEIYLSIGNFDSTATSDTVRSPGFGWAMGGAYYYIDGVSIYEITGICNSYWDAGLVQHIFAGDSVRLGALNTDNSIYAWAASGGGATFLNSNFDPRPWASPTVTTTYYVTKTCPDNSVFKDTVTIYVQQHMAIHEYETIKQDIHIYPNPSNEYFTVQYNFKEPGSIEITDISGKLVGKYNLPANSNKIQLTNERMENGIYLFRVVSEEGVIKAGKIVVMK